MTPEFKPTHIGIGFGEKVIITDCEHGTAKKITHADGFFYYLNAADAEQNFAALEEPLYSEDGTVLR